MKKKILITYNKNLKNKIEEEILSKEITINKSFTIIPLIICEIDTSKIDIESLKSIEGIISVEFEREITF